MYIIYDKNFNIIDTVKRFTDVTIKLGLPKGYSFHQNKILPGLYTADKGKYYIVRAGITPAESYIDLMRLKWALLNPRWSYLVSKYITKALTEFKQNEL